jgi:hypothetical protein
MKFKYLLILIIITFIFKPNTSLALVKIDDETIDLAIKYGLQAKDTSTRNLLDSNWINDGTGKILNIYSPFIQIASKISDQNSTGNTEEDLKTIKKRLYTKINAIKDKNEIRFIVALYGDTEDFAQGYKAYIFDVNQLNKAQKPIKPRKTCVQKIADKDVFVPAHPFSAVNCYTFKFDTLSKLEHYFFILKNEAGEEIRYEIDNSKIF